MNLGRHALARAEFERALELNPNDADVLADFGWSLSFAGEADEGLELMRKAMRQNPHHPDWYLTELGMIQFNARRFAEAAATFERARGVDNVPTRLYHAASLAALGQSEQARSVVDAVLGLDPVATVPKYTDPAMAPYQQARDAEHFRHWLREAGLPQ
jgi:adenylate cyclase